jgi:hypothetical protein
MVVACFFFYRRSVKRVTTLIGEDRPKVVSVRGISTGIFFKTHLLLLIRGLYNTLVLCLHRVDKKYGMSGKVSFIDEHQKSTTRSTGSSLGD